VSALLQRLAVLVRDARSVAAEGAAAGGAPRPRPLPEGVDVRRDADGAWVVLGRAAERAVALSDLTDAGAQAEAVRRLRRLGVDRALARAGARDGDEVRVGDMSFTWGEESA
jgi:GTP-binding protein